MKPDKSAAPNEVEAPATTGCGRLAGMLSIAALLLLAVLSNGCWLYEVVVIKGWEGLKWLDGFPVAAYPLCFFAAFCVVIPVLRRKRPRPLGVAGFVLLGGGILLLSFDITRSWFLKERWFGVPLSLADIVMSPLLSIALTVVGLHALVRLLLIKVSHWHLLFLLIAIILTDALSYATIQILPAIHGYTDSVHAIKMGYPAFWIDLLLAAATELALRVTPRTPVSLRRAG